MEKESGFDPMGKNENADKDPGAVSGRCNENGKGEMNEITDEIGCSVQTVINHLKKEGIYKGEKS